MFGGIIGYIIGGLVIGVTRSDLGPKGLVDKLHGIAEALLPERATPVFEVDARDEQQMNTLLMALIADIEARETVAGAVR